MIFNTKNRKLYAVKVYSIDHLRDLLNTKKVVDIGEITDGDEVLSCFGHLIAQSYSGLYAIIESDRAFTEDVVEHADDVKTCYKSSES